MPCRAASWRRRIASISATWSSAAWPRSGPMTPITNFATAWRPISRPRCVATARCTVAHSDHLSAPQPQVAATRLNWGCGPCATEGWINCDAKDGPGVDLCCDIRDGLPLDDDSVDCVAAIHVLQDLPYADVAAALRELRRVLRPGGVLRLGLPD